MGKITCKAIQLQQKCPVGKGTEMSAKSWGKKGLETKYKNKHSWNKFKKDSGEQFQTAFFVFHMVYI